MTENNLFAAARNEIFGVPPKDPHEMVGYTVARGYFDPIIDRIESVYLGIRMPESDLQAILSNAFIFSSYKAFRRFPKSTLSVIESCNENFRKRYESLLLPKTTTAA